MILDSAIAVVVFVLLVVPGIAYEFVRESKPKGGDPIPLDEWESVIVRLEQVAYVQVAYRDTASERPAPRGGLGWRTRRQRSTVGKHHDSVRE